MTFVNIFAAKNFNYDISLLFKNITIKCGILLELNSTSSFGMYDISIPSFEILLHRKIATMLSVSIFKFNRNDISITILQLLMHLYTL